ARSATPGGVEHVRHRRPGGPHRGRSREGRQEARRPRRRRGVRGRARHDPGRRPRRRALEAARQGSARSRRRARRRLSGDSNRGLTFDSLAAAAYAANAMLLVIDVGNTNTKVGVCDDTRLLVSWSLTTRREQTADEYGLFVETLLRTRGVDTRDITGIAISSVAPKYLSAMSSRPRCVWGTTTWPTSTS